MLNVRLAGDHLDGKLLFTWLSLVMSMMVSFVLSFFPRDVSDEILNLIESVSQGFPTYSYTRLSQTLVNGRACALKYLSDGCFKDTCLILVSDFQESLQVDSTVFFQIEDGYN